MSVRLTSQENRVALFDSVSGFAFGPTFADENEANAFLAHVEIVDGRDARDISPNTLRPIYDRWILLREFA